MKYNLSDICDYAKGKIDVAVLNENTYISTENMMPNKGGITSASSLPTVAQTQAFSAGDVLVSNIRPYFKKIWFAEYDGGCSNDVLVFRAKDGVSKRFLYYVLADDTFFDYSMAISKGTKMPRGDKTAIMKYEVPDFIYKEQDKIAGTLEVLDRKIQLNAAINDNLYQQLDTIYRATYPYLPSDELPAGWKCIPLGVLCDSISVRHSFDKEKLIFLNTGDVENGHFLHSTYSLVRNMPGQAKKSIKTNDILYSEIRPINRHFAFVNFQADDYVVSTKLMVIRSREIDSRRLYHFLTTQDVINELQIEAESRSGTFPQIRFENVQRLPIIIAPPDIELQFTQILKDYYNMIDNNIFENQHLATLRDSILSKLMSGELDVSELDI